MENDDFGAILRDDIDAAPAYLAAAAQRNGLHQQATENEIQWLDEDNDLKGLFYFIPDPRDLAAVTRVFQRTRETRCPLTYIFVHQWTDGEGNWDIFTSRSDRRLEHRGRYGSSTEVTEREPKLRDDIYSLFNTGQEFPSPGRRGWSQLLDQSLDSVRKRLAELADDHHCRQAVEGESLLWHNGDTQLETMFHLLPDPGDLDSVVAIYLEIASRGCPVTFVFVAQEQPCTFDIFRLSARSYLEHHNQAKPGSCD